MVWKGWDSQTKKTKNKSSEHAHVSRASTELEMVAKLVQDLQSKSKTLKIQHSWLWKLFPSIHSKPPCCFERTMQKMSWGIDALYMLLIEFCASTKSTFSSVCGRYVWATWFVWWRSNRSGFVTPDERVGHEARTILNIKPVLCWWNIWFFDIYTGLQHIHAINRILLAFCMAFAQGCIALAAAVFLRGMRSV